jgi:hypothetical protein
MAEEIRFPSSGLFHLHSKKDRRWNLRGQYAGFASDSFPMPMPGEAREALDALAASLGEEPPDDLRWVCTPYPTPGLRRLFDANVFLVTEKRGAFHVLTQELGLGELNMDLVQGEVSFGKPGQPPSRQFPAQFIGLLAQERSLWQWGWVCEETGSMSPAVLKSVGEIRDFGQQQRIPELTYAEIGLGRGEDRPWFSGDYLATVACHVCKADFWIVAPAPDAPGLLMNWIVTAPGVLPAARDESVRIGHVIGEAMATWADALRGSDGRALVRGYAAQKTCKVTEESERRLRIDSPSGGHIFIDFEESGGIYGIEFPPAPQPEPKKVSWFKGLFGGRGGITTPGK